MSSTARLHLRHPLPLFTLPASAFEALDAATRQARIVSFAVSPCGEEESAVLAVWLDAALHDAALKPIARSYCGGCPEFWAGDGGLALVA